MLTLKVKLLKENAKLPVLAHPGEDFGYDVFSAEDGPVTIQPGEQTTIRLGIAVEMGDFESSIGMHGYVLKVGLIAKQPSGLALKRMVDVKAGVIDAGYRNELRTLLFNYGKEPQTFNPGDKIAQLIPVIVLAGPPVEVSELSDSDRGLAGWGSGKTVCEPVKESDFKFNTEAIEFIKPSNE